MLRKHLYYVHHLKDDIPAGIVVFLVALPLCLGIALASGAPLFSGIIGGIIGGLVVSWASGSQLSVSGPAAGLTVIVLAAIERLGGFDTFSLSVAIAGLIQLLLGFLKAGVIGAYFPVSVIKGMLAAIGLILIMKQIPHAVGYDADFEGDETFEQADAHTTFSELSYSFESITPGAVIISVVAIAIMLLWETPFFKRNKIFSLLPGPLVAVIWGYGFHAYASAYNPQWVVEAEHLVNLPAINGPTEFLAQLRWPNFSQLGNPEVYTVALTLAVVASLETLLSLEAVDKIDPLKRVAPTNRELKAQGLGNLLSGLIGGLPLTSVIVRSSANVNAGGRTKVSCFVHGVFLLLSVMFLGQYLNQVPLSALAAVLLLTGYKLAKPSQFIEMYRRGFNQFAPFIVTLLAILMSDLLKGMAVGMGIGLFFVIRANFHAAITLTQDGRHYLLRLQKDVSFLNKALLRDCLQRVGNGGYVIIDGTRAQFVDDDIMETILDFIVSSEDNEITVELKNLNPRPGFVPSGSAH